eukprot:scaffold750_cov146-Isochrysis_galbana.AAC.2
MRAQLAEFGHRSAKSGNELAKSRHELAKSGHELCSFTVTAVHTAVELSGLCSFADVSAALRSAASV